MSATDESSYEDGAPRRFEVSAAEGRDLLEVAVFLKRFVEDESARQGPSAQLLAALRSQDDRLKPIEEMVDALVFDTVDTDLIKAWLEDGYSPFDRKNFPKANPDTYKPQDALKRGTKRVKNREAAVEKARRAVAKAEQELAEAEAELDRVEGYERAMVYWHFAQDLAKMVAPHFAMGPAWTIMRALSAHVSDEALENACGLEHERDRAEAERTFIAARAAETEVLLASLYFFSGEFRLEEELRAAIADVCKAADKRRPALEKSGRRDRSRTKRKAEVHPMAREDFDEVIEGLRRAE